MQSAVDENDTVPDAASEIGECYRNVQRHLLIAKAAIVSGYEEPSHNPLSGGEAITVSLIVHGDNTAHQKNFKTLLSRSKVETGLVGHQKEF